MSAKKKLSGPGPAQIRIEAPTVQSAVERRAAEAELRTLIDKFAPERLRLITAMRRSLRKRLPSANELVYEYRSWFVVSYSPTERGHEGVFAIRADTNRVKLYFNPGKDLPDPAKLLRGSGLTRWIGVETASTLARTEVERLIEETLSRNRVPFAADGRGSVVVRSAAGKPPRGRRKA